MFQGTITALITPFLDTPSSRPALDLDTFESLIEWQIECGVNGFVIAGTTGESVTLDSTEKIQLARRAMEIVKKRVPVIVGTGSNCTTSTIELTKAVKSLGADGVLIVSPYYNKPTQEGLFAHFSAVAKEGGLPVIVYNIPSRASVEISIQTFRRLTKVPGIVAVKQAVDSGVRLMELAEAVDGAMTILAGDDPLTYLVHCVGGKGVISASASAIPKEMLAITEAALRGDFQAALTAQKNAISLINALFIETNPAPVKAALKMLGRLPYETLRLPLVPVTAASREIIRETFITHVGL